MKKVLFLTLTFLGLLTSCAQNKPAPDYLLNQKFPDSIQQYEIENLKGEKVAFKQILEKHKGKKVVLDFWASWCGDCLKSLPNLQNLQKETKNVDYVFLSLDKESGRWKKAIEKLNIEGDHYFMPDGWKNTLTNYIGLDWIPRYMILDEEGKIINAKAVKATDEDFKKLVLK